MSVVELIKHGFPLSGHGVKSLISDTGGLDRNTGFIHWSSHYHLVVPASRVYAASLLKKL